MDKKTALGLGMGVGTAAFVAALLLSKKLSIGVKTCSPPPLPPPSPARIGIYPEAVLMDNCQNLSLENAVRYGVGLNANYMARGYARWGIGTKAKFNALEKFNSYVPTLAEYSMFTHAVIPPDILANPNIGDMYGDGTKVTKEEFMEMALRDKNGELIPHYFHKLHYTGDIRKESFRRLIVSWAEKSQANSLEFDTFGMEQNLKGMTFEEWESAFVKLCSEARVAGTDKKICFHYPLETLASEGAFVPAGLDYMFLGIPKEDVSDLVWTSDFNIVKDNIRRVYGEDLPIVTFMDYAGAADTAFKRFTALNVSQQIFWLDLAYKRCKENGVLLCLPVYGMTIDGGLYDATRVTFYDDIQEIIGWNWFIVEKAFFGRSLDGYEELNVEVKNTGTVTGNFGVLISDIAGRMLGYFAGYSIPPNESISIKYSIVKEAHIVESTDSNSDIIKAKRYSEKVVSKGS